MPTESAYPSARGAIFCSILPAWRKLPRHLGHHDLGSKGANAVHSCGAQEGESTLASDKDQVKAVPWECQAPSKAPGASRCWGAEQDPWRAKHPCISRRDQSFPPAQAAGEYVWACLAGGCHMPQQHLHLPSPVPPPRRWARPRCLRLGRVGCSSPRLPLDGHGGTGRKGERRMGNVKAS